jgi:hypothetical protein
MENDGKERTLGLETILETELLDEPPQSINLEPSETFQRIRTRSLGKAAFALMLLGGVAFLLIYSKLPEILNSYRMITVQQAISTAGFADWQKIVLIALCAFIFALLAHRSRNRVRSDRLSTT